MAEKALSHLKVIDLSWHIAGPYCTKMLADFGADVIKIERPMTGDPSRLEGPFPNNEPDVNASGLFVYLNHNKRSITVDLKTEEGVQLIKNLVQTADIVVENFAPGVMERLGLNYDALKVINPKLVYVSITNFGQKGDYAHYKATELITQAMSGFVSGIGEATREPLRAAGQLRLLEYISGTFAAASALACVQGSRKKGVGAHVDISITEMGLLQRPYPTVQNSYPMAPFKHVMRYVMMPAIEKCKDGYVGISVLTGQHWQDFCFMTEMYDWVEDERFTTMPKRQQHRAEFQARLDDFLMRHTKKEIMELGTQWRVPVTLVPSFKDIVALDHYVARDFFKVIEHPKLGTIKQPGAPFILSETPWSIRQMAPQLGEHNEAILEHMQLEQSSN